MSNRLKQAPDPLAKVRARRERAMADFLNENGRIINLAAFPANTPCPICETVIEELKNVPINKHFATRHKNGETHPYVCWICVQRLIDPPKCYMQKTDVVKRARGWKLMSVYVDSTGTVFHKGVEQTELKGTLPETVIADKEKTKKPSRLKKDEMAQDALLIINDVHKKLKDGMDDDGNPFSKKTIALMEREIKKQQKIINTL